MISNKSILEDSEHFNKWLKLTLLPCFKDLKELSERVTAKKTYQEYLEELREKLHNHIEEINNKINDANCDKAEVKG